MQRLDPIEFEGWLAYWQIEPFGTMHEDNRHARLCHTVASCGFVHVKDVDLDVFKPRYGPKDDAEPEPEETVNPKEMARQAARAAARWVQFCQGPRGAVNSPPTG